MGDNVAVHSHPIADSVNQLSVASFEIVLLQRLTEANKPAA